MGPSLPSRRPTVVLAGMQLLPFQGSNQLAMAEACAPALCLQQKSMVPAKSMPPGRIAGSKRIAVLTTLSIVHPLMAHIGQWCSVLRVILLMVVSITLFLALPSTSQPLAAVLTWR